jgi:hypothetical protein
MLRRAEAFPDDAPGKPAGYFQTDFKPNNKILEYEPIWLN